MSVIDEAKELVLKYNIAKMSEVKVVVQLELIHNLLKEIEKRDKVIEAYSDYYCVDTEHTSEHAKAHDKLKKVLSQLEES